MKNILPPRIGSLLGQNGAKSFLCGLLLLGFVPWSCLTLAAPAPSQSPSPKFPDFGFLAPPSQYSGEPFRLSQDYPKEKPDGKKLPAFFAKLPKSFTTDFTGWREYMMAIRDYCFEGNLDVDWRVEKNNVRKWYHIPWQHYGPSGRESIHGLTKEAPVAPGQLAASQGRPGPGENLPDLCGRFFQ